LGEGGPLRNLAGEEYRRAFGVELGLGLVRSSNPKEQGPPANAPASPSIGQGIEPFQVMVNAKELPTVEFVDYTFVFPH